MGQTESTREEGSQNNQAKGKTDGWLARPGACLLACQGDPEIELGVSQRLSSQDHSPQSSKLILQQLSCFEYRDLRESLLDPSFHKGGHSVMLRIMSL